MTMQMMLQALIMQRGPLKETREMNIACYSWHTKMMTGNMQGRVQSRHAPPTHPPFHIWWEPTYPDSSNNAGHKPPNHYTEYCNAFICWFWIKILIKLKASSFCSPDWLLASCQTIHPISFSTFIKCSLFSWCYIQPNPQGGGPHLVNRLWLAYTVYSVKAAYNNKTLSLL